jgi:hypothetical protein
MKYLALLLCAVPAATAQTRQFDLVVYGATAAGVVAAWKEATAYGAVKSVRL